mmetsp:Transcript_13812/g.37075  ORF Transcript_13812/g.37075 Transcript_13812/m.37075 type:complete len:170 (-) Transcript_13812:263-772(-)
MFHKSVDGFDAFNATLSSALTLCALEKDLHMVLFHPRYCIRDGASRSGAKSDAVAGAVNEKQNYGAVIYARRSPWGMIHLLRTSQVRAAQGVVPTGLIYWQNERTLQEVRSAQLEAMLKSATGSTVRRAHWSIAAAVQSLRLLTRSASIESSSSNSRLPTRRNRLKNSI